VRYIGRILYLDCNAHFISFTSLCVEIWSLTLSHRPLVVSQDTF